MDDSYPTPAFDPSDSQIGSRLTRQLPPVPSQPLYLSNVNPRSSHSSRARRSSCLGRALVLLLVWLFGIVVGLSALFWYGLNAQGPIVLVPRTTKGNVIIEADAAFVTQLVQRDLADAGLPGTVENVQVKLEHGTMMVITGVDTGNALGVPFSRHFTVNVQPYVQSCMVQVRVTHADLGGLPVTSFVQSFEGNINTQLAQKPGGLPGGFTPCAMAVRTEPGGLFITYQITSTP